MPLFVSIKPKDVKVSYDSRFNSEGTHYTQMVSVTLSDEQINVFNNMVRNTLSSRDASHMAKTYLREINVEDNFTNLTTFEYFKRFFTPLLENQRIKSDRNTLLRIKKVEK